MTDHLGLPLLFCPPSSGRAESSSCGHARCPFWLDNGFQPRFSHAAACSTHSGSPTLTMTWDKFIILVMGALCERLLHTQLNGLLSYQTVITVRGSKVIVSYQPSEVCHCPINFSQSIHGNGLSARNIEEIYSCKALMFCCPGRRDRSSSLNNRINTSAVLTRYEQSRTWRILK